MKPVAASQKKSRPPSAPYVPNKRGKINSRQIEVMKDHFQDRSIPPPNHEIKSYMKDAFDLNYSERNISIHRRDWKILSREQSIAPSNLNLDQRKAIGEHFSQLDESPSWNDLQVFVFNTFGIHYSKAHILQYQSSWGVKPTCDPRRFLTDQEIGILKAHFRTHNKPPTTEEIQDFLVDRFDVLYAKSLITSYKRAWGFLISETSARALSESEVMNLKDHFTHREPNPTWQRVQGYIQDHFGLRYSKYLLQRSQPIWDLIMEGKGTSSKSKKPSVVKPNDKVKIQKSDTNFNTLSNVEDPELVSFLSEAGYFDTSLEN